MVRPLNRLLTLSGCLVFLANGGQERIRTGVEAVAVDFLAVDSAGDPVLDLQPSEIALTINGKRRAISSLTLLRSAAPSSLLIAGEKKPEAQTSTGAVSSGRTVILLFAHENVRADQRGVIVAGAARFVSRLPPTDRVSVVTIPNGRVEVDLTTDHQSVQAALNRVAGYSSSQVPVDTRLTVLAMVDVLNSLAPIDGPKVVVLVAQGLVAEAADLRTTGAAAANARAHLYVVQPDNFMIGAAYRSPPDERVVQDAQKGLEDLTGVTGGELFRVSGRADAIFERIARESAAYYLAGFAVEDADRTGKPRSIRIAVTRRGVTVRARPSFIAENRGNADLARPKQSRWAGW